MSQTETPIDVVRRICAEHKIKSSLVVGGSRRADVAQVRTICMLEVKAKFPEMTRRQMAEMFGLSPNSVTQAVSRHVKGGLFTRKVDRSTWADTPENVLRAQLALHKFSPETVSRLMNNSRTGKITRIRRDLLDAVTRSCPGITGSELARLFNLDQTAISHYRRRAKLRNNKIHIKN